MYIKKLNKVYFIILFIMINFKIHIFKSIPGDFWNILAQWVDLKIFEEIIFNFFEKRIHFLLENIEFVVVK
jgi:hypothetical protein